MNIEEIRYAKTLASQIKQFGMSEIFILAFKNGEREVIDSLLTAAADIWTDKVNKMKNMCLTQPDFLRSLTEKVAYLDD